MELLKCKVCEQTLSPNDFRKISKTNRRSSVCKKCSSELIDKGFKVCSCCENILPYTNDFFNLNSKSKYGLDTTCKECVRNKVSKWQKLNKEKTYDKVKKYMSSEKGKCANVSKTMRYEAKRRKLDYSLTENQWDQIKAEFNNCCAYCGKPKKLEREHVIPLTHNGEYTIKNIIPACKSCNCSKGNKDFLTWYRKQEFYSLDRENKIRERI